MFGSNTKLESNHPLIKTKYTVMYWEEGAGRARVYSDHT